MMFTLIVYIFYCLTHNRLTDRKSGITTLPSKRSVIGILQS